MAMLRNTTRELWRQYFDLKDKMRRARTVDERNRLANELEQVRNRIISIWEREGEIMTKRLIGAYMGGVSAAAIPATIERMAASKALGLPRTAEQAAQMGKAAAEAAAKAAKRG
ncbi:MAG: hypothetical protein RMK89_13985, partial [Armatimonadota bacterium]|nr:hypothetical protein [Armatimonadota bacterium]MDW8144555.1 hypothetical protein [Armatimonadota bacterium]